MHGCRLQSAPAGELDPSIKGLQRSRRSLDRPLILAKVVGDRHRMVREAEVERHLQGRSNVV